ncbi:MAG: polyprenyl synthetase family protein [Thermodesulfobacteriota bacterium]
MNSFDIQKYLAKKKDTVDSCLLRFLNGIKGNARIADAMRHSLLAGGKRLRPILCIAAAESMGGSEISALPAACALEMIHTYSLVHDDLPAMDNDDLRRGKPTCHVAFDEATAILAGDALLTLAFEILSDMDRWPEAISPREYLRIIHGISVAAGHQGMIAGQMTDILAEGAGLTLEELEAMHRAKTGALIEASVCTGGLLAGADTSRMENLRQYARNIGLAFQVTDDILNVEGDPDILGKAVGTDENRRKSTYPSLLGIQRSKELSRCAVEKALDAVASFDEKARPLRELATYIIRRQQ